MNQSNIFEFKLESNQAELNLSKNPVRGKSSPDVSTTFDTASKHVA